MPAYITSANGAGGPLSGSGGSTTCVGRVRARAPRRFTQRQTHTRKSNAEQHTQRKRPTSTTSTTIGRSRRADVALEHEGHSVSRVHARVDAGALAVIVVDLGSSKGTRVGSAAAEKVTSSVLLPGDQIFLGESVLTYKLGETKGSGGGSSGGKKKGLFGMFKK